MKLVIQKHTYAPELNKALIHTNKGRFVGILPCPGIKSISEARKALFAPLMCKGQLFTIRKEYPADTIQAKSCNKVVSGFGDNAMALQIKRELIKQGSAGAILFDGSIMPACAVSISMRVIG